MTDAPKLHPSVAICKGCGERFLKSIGPLCQCENIAFKKATELPVSRIVTEEDCVEIKPRRKYTKKSAKEAVELGKMEDATAEDAKSAAGKETGENSNSHTGTDTEKWAARPTRKYTRRKTSNDPAARATTKKTGGLK